MLLLLLLEQMACVLREFLIYIYMCVSVEKLCITGARSNMRIFSSLTEPTKIHHHTELHQNPRSTFQLKSNFLSTNHLYGSHQYIVMIYGQTSKTSCQQQQQQRYMLCVMLCNEQHSQQQMNSTNIKNMAFQYCTGSS